MHIEMCTCVCIYVYHAGVAQRVGVRHRERDLHLEIGIEGAATPGEDLGCSASAVTLASWDEGNIVARRGESAHVELEAGW